jgi:hypothetical protein
MRTRTVSLIAAAAAFAGAAAADAARHVDKAKTPTALRDCANDGDLDRIYSPPALRRALKAMPTDLANYTDCADVIRAAFAAGPSVRVVRHRAHLRVRCARNAYRARMTVRNGAAGSAKVPACRRGTRVVLVGLGPAGQLAARRHRIATVTLRPNGKVLRFVVRLRTRR